MVRILQEVRVAATQVVPGLYRIPLGYVNAYALVARDSVTLIDTGLPGRHDRILEALGQIGHGPGSVAAIVVTHLHADHTGGLKAIRDETRAPVYAHPVDARAIRDGISIRRVGPEGTWLGRALGLVGRSVGRLVPMLTAAPAEVDAEVTDGDRIHATVPLEVLHAPGHSAGQIALLWREHGGVLIAGDAASNRRGRLGSPPFYENTADGEATLRRLASLDFEVAVFGHGDPIRSRAAKAFRDRFG